MTVIANDNSDQTANVINAMATGEILPPGDIRITSDLINTASSATTFSPGITLRGSGMLRTRIIADYDGNYILGGIVRLDTAAVGHYSIGNVISDLTLMPAVGRTGLNGISLTAAWYNSIKRVRMLQNPLGGQMVYGIVTPIRTDLSSISDLYQCFGVDVEMVDIQQCTGHGIDFGAGQSPGLFRVAYSQIIENNQIGIRTTTGQCEIDSNVISYNGTGGIMFDTAEGPSMVGSVTRNEIQDNGYWGMNLVRSRDLRIISNRFLSQTYSAAVGGSPQNGTSFMRQAIHVDMANGSSAEVWNLLAQGNLHRSGGSPLATTATCYGYYGAAASLSSAHPCQFLHNDFGPVPFDGLTQNSVGFVPYFGLSGTGAVIVDP